MIPFPNKRYQIIYADPPWQHNSGGKIGDGGDAAPPYPTLSFAELSELPVQEIASDNCLLFLWVLSCDLERCIKIGKKWGFRFSTIGFVWEKQASMAGFYTMSNCEICLVFKRGRIPKPRGKRNIRQFLSVKRGRHSEKPNEVRRRIVEMFPTQDKIELFARQRADGWDAWGNEV